MFIILCKNVCVFAFTFNVFGYMIYVIIILLADFEILAFPCNQFLGQEPGTNEEIQETVCTRFKAEFPIFDKVIFDALIFLLSSCY